MIYSLCEEWVDDGVEEGDEDEDEGGVDELHLVGLDDVGANGAVHPGDKNKRIVNRFRMEN